MITTPTKRKQLLEFLISRWMNLVEASSVEIVYINARQYATDNDLCNPEMPILAIAQPRLQIQIIKRYIVQILPEAKFIEYSYEPPAPLEISDFIEIHAIDHKRCANRVKELMEKMNIT